MVPAIQTTRTTVDPSSFSRMIPMSLPRVRWMERDANDNRIVDPVAVTKTVTPSDELDTQCYDMRESGDTFSTIADRLNIGKTSARKYYSREKERRLRQGVVDNTHREG